MTRLVTLDILKATVLLSSPYRNWKRVFGVLDFIPIMTWAYNHVLASIFSTMGYTMFAFLFEWTNQNWYTLSLTPASAHLLIHTRTGSRDAKTKCSGSPLPLSHLLVSSGGAARADLRTASASWIPQCPRGSTSGSCLSRSTMVNRITLSLLIPSLSACRSRRSCQSHQDEADRAERTLRFLLGGWRRRVAF